MKPTEIQQRLTDLLQANPIVIWNDPAAEFAGMLDELDLPGTDVVIDVDGDRFALKAELNALKPDERLLIYRPEPEAPKPDWLADAVTYAPSFSADRTTLLLEEINACDTPEMRTAVASFSSYLSTAGHLRRMQELRPRYTTPQQLALSVMAAALGPGIPADAERVIIAYICRAHAEGDERVQATLKRAGAAHAFAQLLVDCLGYTADAADAHAISEHILMCALEPFALPGVPQSTGDAMTLRHAADVARLWIQVASTDSDAYDALLQAATSLEVSCDLGNRLQEVPTRELAELHLFPVADALVIRRLATELGGTGFDADALRAVLERRRAGVWAKTYRECYAALDAALYLRTFAIGHPGTLATADALTVWQAYTADWSLVDTAYRRFHVTYSRIRLDAPYDLDGPFHELALQIESWYRGWFLRQTSAAWESAAASSFARNGSAPDIPLLDDFYLSHVDTLAHKKKRAWVIISDALRYEVARELADALEASTQGQTALTSMQAPFPSITLCGMAALLPHDRYRLSVADTTEQRGIVATVDGMPTQGTSARNSVLNAYLASHQPGAKGLALQAADFIRSSRAERKEAVGDATVVYLYHNRIDAVGDDAATEDDVFRACADTVDEICQLVSLIVRDFRASDILITADHGFLYTYLPLAETDKLSANDVSGTVIEMGRRYVVGDRTLASPVMLPVSLDRVSADTLTGLAPHEAIRVKKAGGGSKYVHGGISLQELCVPVIHFKNYRSGMRGFTERSLAGLSLVTQLPAITNLSCSLEVLQTEPVGGKVLPATYEVQLQTLDGEALSDVATLRADRTDVDATKRTFPFTLHVKSAYVGKSGVPCQLVARCAHADGHGTGALPSDPIVLAETQLHIAFAPEEESAWW